VNEEAVRQNMKVADDGTPSILFSLKWKGEKEICRTSGACGTFPLITDSIRQWDIKSGKWRYRSGSMKRGRIQVKLTA
jgi:hypothetical protein